MRSALPSACRSLNPLYIIVEGEEGNFYIPQGPTLREMDKFQRYVAKQERVMFVNSIASNLPAIFNGIIRR